MFAYLLAILSVGVTASEMEAHLASEESQQAVMVERAADLICAAKYLEKMKNGRMRKGKADAIKKADDRFEAAKQALREPPIEAPAVDLVSADAGDVGRLFIGSERYIEGEVFQAVDRRGALIDVGDYTLWLSGIDASSIVDGLPVGLPEYIEVVGTRQYGTVAGGSKQVWEVRPADIHFAINSAKQQWLEGQFRTWTDATGQYSTEARIVEVKRAFVTLQKRDGIDVSLTLAKLSEADQAFAAKWLEQGKQIEEAAVAFIQARKAAAAGYGGYGRDGCSY